MQHRAPRRVRPGYPSRRSGGGWGHCARGTACARTAGVARRPRRLRGMPAPIPPCVRGAPPAASAQRGCAEYPGRQTRQAGASPAVTPAPGHRCCRCTGGAGVPLCHSCSGVCAARGAPVPSAGVAAAVPPVMSEQRCSGFLRREVHMCSGGEDRYHGSHPLLLLFPGLCPAARLLPPPVLREAGLMLPITKLLAEVGIKHFRRGPFTAGSAPESSPQAQGSGVRPGDPGCAACPGPTARSCPRQWKCLGSSPSALRCGPEAAPWVAGWQLPLPFSVQEIHWSRLCVTVAESSLKTLAFPFLALLACLLINKQHSQGAAAGAESSFAPAPAEAEPAQHCQATSCRLGCVLTPLAPKMFIANNDPQTYLLLQQ